MLLIIPAPEFNPYFKELLYNNVIYLIKIVDYMGVDMLNYFNKTQ